MNRTQLEYALARLKEAADQKYNEARVRYTKKGVPFDGPALVAAIKAGKVKVREDFVGKVIGRYDDVSTVFTDFKDLDKPDVLDKAAFDKAAAPITAEFNSVKDQLILGDAKGALVLIEAFAAKKF